MKLKLYLCAIFALFLSQYNAANSFILPKASKSHSLSLARHICNNNLNYAKVLGNTITCMEGESIPEKSVGSYMHYVINFENNTSSEVQDIIVKMNIKPEDLDINTLEIIHASDALSINITGNTAELVFKKIKLKGGGHGNVMLKIKSQSTLKGGDIIENNAEIYFDSAPPINTNVYNTLVENSISALQAKISYNGSNLSTGSYAINFDGSMSTGNITSFAWSFSGNPTVSSSTVSNPIVTYNTPGSYSATLTVTDNTAATSTQTVNFEVGSTSTDLSSGKDANGNFVDINSNELNWKGYDANGTLITPSVRETYTGWSYADLGNGVNSRWITLNNLEGYYAYKSTEFTIPDNATDAALNLMSLSFVRNWTYLVKKNTDGTETETKITQTQWMTDGAKGWLNSRSPIVSNYALSPGTYYIKVLVYSNNTIVRESVDVNANVSCSVGIINTHKSGNILGVSTSTKIEQNISVYPIPTKNMLTIEANNSLSSIEIFDTQGKLVQKNTQTGNAKKINLQLSGISSGIYFVKINAENGAIVKKIIKE